MCRTIPEQRKYGYDYRASGCPVGLRSEKKLDQIAEIREETISDVVRQLIASAYEDAMLERRLLAVQRMAEANVEEMPDPEELARQMNNKYNLD